MTLLGKEALRVSQYFFSQIKFCWNPFGQLSVTTPDEKTSPPSLVKEICPNMFWIQLCDIQRNWYKHLFQPNHIILLFCEAPTASSSHHHDHYFLGSEPIELFLPTVIGRSFANLKLFIKDKISWNSWREHQGKLSWKHFKSPVWKGK